MSPVVSRWGAKFCTSTRAFWISLRRDSMVSDLPKPLSPHTHKRTTRTRASTHTPKHTHSHIQTCTHPYPQSHTHKHVQREVEKRILTTVTAPSSAARLSLMRGRATCRGCPCSNRDCARSCTRKGTASAKDRALCVCVMGFLCEPRELDWVWHVQQSIRLGEGVLLPCNFLALTMPQPANTQDKRKT